MADCPTVSAEAVAMSKDLVRRGFLFVGPTICYAFMQAAGMVNDHLVRCFRYLARAQSRWLGPYSRRFTPRREPTCRSLSCM